MRDLPAKARFRVFLNYPFDHEFDDFSVAMHFAVTAANLIPVCAKDIGAPDQVRLQLLVDLVTNCDYSAHDLSRYKPDPNGGFARMNMPFETGMALYRSISTDYKEHRCAILVTNPHAYKAFVSDLAGLDAMSYGDDVSLVRIVYQWLTSVVPQSIRSDKPSAYVADLYLHLKQCLKCLRGSGQDGSLDHSEMQELIRRVCDAGDLWTWRTGPLAEEFPPVALFFIENSEYRQKGDHKMRRNGRRLISPPVRKKP
jgi:hypothetical protein